MLTVMKLEARVLARISTCSDNPREVHIHHKAFLLVLGPVKSYTARTSRVRKLSPPPLCMVGVLSIPYALSCIFSFLIEVGFVYFR